MQKSAFTLWEPLLQVPVFTLPEQLNQFKIWKISGIKYISKIYEAAKKMMEVVHNLGVSRVEVILKIDSRKDKDKKMEEKLESVKKLLK
jgi:hypothetical protein